MSSERWVTLPDGTFVSSDAVEVVSCDWIDIPTLTDPNVRCPGNWVYCIASGERFNIEPPEEDPREQIRSWWEKLVVGE